MSDFKAKMHKIRFLLGLSPRPRAPPDSLPVFKGPTSKRREGKGYGRGGEEKGRRVGLPLGSGSASVLGYPHLNTRWRLEL